MRISVIMPSYKMGRFIRAALDSVGQQSCCDWEVIVVEDCGPEDGTEAIVREFAKTHPEHRIEFIRHEKNTGVSGARNTAMAASKGDLLAFLDPDDAWTPGYLEQMQKLLAEADICASGAIRIDERNQSLGSYIYGPTQQRIAGFPQSLAKANFFNPSFTVIRREVYEKIGRYDEAPEIQHAEDWDYWLRALAAGFRFHFTPDELCLYREHSGAATSNFLRMSNVCAECLRRNIPRHQGEIRKILKQSLYEELLVLARLRRNHHADYWNLPLLDALRLFPFRTGAYKRFLRLLLS
jgi:glycosyltransferase involved in cell wall biosynthesis